MNLENAQKEKSIDVLDAIPKNIKTRLLINGLWLCGIKVQEAKFFSGYLRTKDGESIYMAAHSKLNGITFKAAEKCLEQSKILKDLNREWGRETVMLYIAKYFYRIVNHEGDNTISKILVADALSRDQDDEKCHLILGLPRGLTKDFFEDISEAIYIDTYSLWEWSIKKTRLSILLLISFFWVKKLNKWLLSLFQTRTSYGNVNTSALLLLQEDDISIDRSYRGQPHWLFKDDPPPAFRTLVLEKNLKLRQPIDQHELDNYQVYCVPKDMQYSYAGKSTVGNSINSAIRVLLYQSFFGSKSTLDVSFELALLFFNAFALASFCKEQNVKSFMSCENYYPETDAMNLIGSSMGIHTLSYQYSNISAVGTAMRSTAETMLLFSEMFQKRWANNWIKSKKYIETGYIFDSSFNLIRKRALNQKNSLSAKGAKFIITYFDESVQKNNKYGLISRDDHYAELYALFKLVLDKDEIAVITKSQFMINTPSALFPNDALLKKAIQTDRFFELHHGKHRNNIFPAEAAMASSIVIGHVVGATSGLEAVLAGSRCILINPYKMKGPNVEILQQADILYDNIDAALDAISSFRQGKKEFKNLGVWDSIIDLFDPFRDGKSARRMREYIENTILTE